MVKIEGRHCGLKGAASESNRNTAGKLDLFGNRRRNGQRDKWRAIHLWHLDSRQAVLLERPYARREIHAAAKEDTCPIASFHTASLLLANTHRALTQRTNR